MQKLMTPSTPARQAPSISRERVKELRKMIDDARALGAADRDIELHATQRDEALLKRSQDIAVADLSFTGGEIRFLGVKVVRATGPRSTVEKV